MQLLEPPIPPLTAAEPPDYHLQEASPSFWQPRKGHEKCIFETQWDKICFDQKDQISMKKRIKILLTVRADRADPPPPYGQPDRKILVFLTTCLRSKLGRTDWFKFGSFSLDSFRKYLKICLTTGVSKIFNEEQMKIFSLDRLGRRLLLHPVPLNPTSDYKDPNALVDFFWTHSSHLNILL